MQDLLVEDRNMDGESLEETEYCLNELGENIYSAADSKDSRLGEDLTMSGERVLGFIYEFICTQTFESSSDEVHKKLKNLTDHQLTDLKKMFRYMMELCSLIIMSKKNTGVSNKFSDYFKQKRTVAIWPEVHLYLSPIIAGTKSWIQRALTIKRLSAHKSDDVSNALKFGKSALRSLVILLLAQNLK